MSLEQSIRKDCPRSRLKSLFGSHAAEAMSSTLDQPLEFPREKKVFDIIPFVPAWAKDYIGQKQQATQSQLFKT